MNNIKYAPCYGCSKRKNGCHVECKLYALYRQRVEVIRAAKKKDTELYRTEMNALYWAVQAGRERK